VAGKLLCFFRPLSGLLLTRVEFFSNNVNQTPICPVLSVMSRDELPVATGFARFLWWCGGAVEGPLRLFPTEWAKHEGIGGAVLTTGVFAFLSGFYAVYTTLANGPYGIATSIGVGAFWGLAIFNLDRYIVSSLRKPTGPELRLWPRLSRTWLPVLPRVGLAIVIGISLSKPLELRLFQSAVASQAELNRDRLLIEKKTNLVQGSRLNEIQADANQLTAELTAAEDRARFLEDEFRKESDGTGGSLRYGYSEVARVKQAAAVQARQAAAQLRADTAERAKLLQSEADNTASALDRQLEEFRKSLTGDFLTKMAALADLSANSPSIWWISAFVTFLLIGIEITPVLVKVLSPIGPYDIKLDALNSVEANEMLLKRDTAIQIAAHHYELVEKAERQADDQFFNIRTSLAENGLDQKANQWKAERAAGATSTMERLVGEIKKEIFTLRSS
jgi:hypothetical protein